MLTIFDYPFIGDLMTVLRCLQALAYAAKAYAARRDHGKGLAPYYAVRALLHALSAAKHSLDAS
ncbi:MAG: hypothetical protein ABL962_09865 [Fimbriimonadaceae bacterium]